MASSGTVTLKYLSKNKDSTNVDIVEQPIDEEQIKLFRVFRNMFEDLSGDIDEIDLTNSEIYVPILPNVFNFLFEFSNYLNEHDINKDNWQSYLHVESTYGDSALARFIRDLLIKYTGSSDKNKYKRLMIGYQYKTDEQGVDQSERIDESEQIDAILNIIDVYHYDNGQESKDNESYTIHILTCYTATFICKNND